MTSSNGSFRHEQYASPWIAAPQTVPTAGSSSSNSGAPLPVATTTTQNLAATGRKRKRLQRACVACHKAKRRCDGGLPCSNCDFSGRLCNYSDSQGKSVAPTKRTLKPSEAAILEEQQRQQQQPNQSFSLHPMHLPHPSAPPQQQPTSSAMPPRHGSMYGSPPSSTSSPSMSPRMDTQRFRVEPSLETRRELLLIFFSHLQPMSSVFDEISFLRDLSSDKVLRVLLYAMYAVSASYAFEENLKQQQANPSNPAKYSKLIAEAGDGSRYVQEARRLLYREDERSGQSKIDGSANLEVAQSLYLLAFFEFSHGHYFRASSYVHLSSKHVTALNTSVDLSMRENNLEDDKARHLQQRNMRRLACLLGAMDISMSMMNGQSMTTKSWEVEAAMESFTLSPVDEDEETVSMLHLLNVSFVLNTALELRQKSRTYPHDVTKQAAQCEDELQRWAQHLPRSLHFDDARLHHVEQVLNDRLSPSLPNSQVSQMSKGGAICWILMHTMAETTTLILKEVTNTSDRESKMAACKNLVILLEKGNASSLPRLFASLSVSVLYSVTCSVAEQHDNREWGQIWNSARTYANYVRLQEKIESSMAIWWKRRNSSLSPHSINRISLPSPTSSLNGYRGATSPSLRSSTTTTSHRSSLPSPPPNTSYHYLPPLTNLGTSPPTLPPLRIGGNGAEKSGRHFWDQPPRPLSILTSTK